MSKYFEIDAQSKFRIPKNDDLTGGLFGWIDDIGRLMYSEATERLYIRGFSTWIEVSTPYDILGQETKILFGSYPLPDGWTIPSEDYSDRIILLDTNISQIGDEGGSWTITGINAAGSHNHNLDAEMASITTQIDYGQSTISSGWHGHFTTTQSGHDHSFGGAWRPYNVSYCIGEYDPLPDWVSYYTWNVYWEPGYVSCWDPTIPSIGGWSGCTGDYIEVKGTWADDLRPTKFRLIHDGPDDNLDGLRNISLHESDYSYLATAAPKYKYDAPPWGADTTYGYNSGTEIPITWGSNDMLRLNVENYNTGAGNQIAITDIQFLI